MYNDGQFIKLLGYKFDTAADILFPGIAELNFNKKVSGSRKPNTHPITNSSEAEAHVKDLVITRRMVCAKTAELFDGQKPKKSDAW